MTDQIRTLLDDRERTLTAAIAALRAELMPMEEELAQIRRAKAALGVPIIGGPPISSSSHAHMTIKQLIMECLTVHFTSGAKAHQLREFIRDAWGCDISRASFSPQLSRLYIEKIIDRNSNVWFVPGAEA